MNTIAQQAVAAGLQLPRAQVTVLPCGVRVVTRHVPSAATTTCGVWVAAGSGEDRAAGTAHFLEHLAFKGSRAHPDQTALERDVERRGTHLHAYTTREHACYFARGLARDAEANAALVADLALHPLHAQAKVDAERATIAREMEEVAAVPEEVVLDMLHRLVFGAQHQFGRPILGTPASIRAITRAQIQEHHRRCYTAPRTVFAAAGGRVCHTETVRLAQRLFARAPPSSPLLPCAPAPAPAAASAASFASADVPALLDTNPRRVAERDPLCFAVVGAAGAGTPATKTSATKQQCTWLVLQALLGSASTGMDAIEEPAGFCALLQQRGLVRTARALWLPYNHCGVFGVYYEAPASATAAVCRAVAQEYARLARKGVQHDHELQLAKQHAKRQLVLGTTSTTAAMCDDLGRQCLVRGAVAEAAELCAGIDAVGREDVQRLAWEALLARGRRPLKYAVIGTEMKKLHAQGKVPTEQDVKSLCDGL